jgi:hypothetical protein
MLSNTKFAMKFDRIVVEVADEFSMTRLDKSPGLPWTDDVGRRCELLKERLQRSGQNFVFDVEDGWLIRASPVLMIEFWSGNVLQSVEVLGVAKLPPEIGGAPLGLTYVGLVNGVEVLCDRLTRQTVLVPDGEDSEEDPREGGSGEDFYTTGVLDDAVGAVFDMFEKRPGGIAAFRDDYDQVEQWLLSDAAVNYLSWRSVYLF